MSASLIVLGTGSAVQTAQRDNTAFAFRMNGVGVLIDCPGSVPLKLRRTGFDPMHLAAVVITHTHLDHAYGLLSLVDNLRLLDRTAPLPVFAPREGLDRLRALLAVFDLDRKSGFVDLRPIPSDERSVLWEHAGNRLYAMSVDHGPPAFAVRWDLPGGGRAVYSSDTRPLDVLAEFGRGAELFIHEATHRDADAAIAQDHGHSTARQAGSLASRAGARRLLLVHVGRDVDVEQWIAEAQTAYSGPVEIPSDGAVYLLD